MLRAGCNRGECTVPAPGGPNSQHARPAQHSSMMFSLESWRECLPAAEAAPGRSDSAELTLQRLVAAEPRDLYLQQLNEDVQHICSAMCTAGGRQPGADITAALACRLAAAGHHVAVRQSLSGGAGASRFTNLRHSFLLVSRQSSHDAGGDDIIVEPHFREQFEIRRPTPRYSGVLAQLPHVVVGTAAQLEPLVQLLCAEMAAAFAEQGLPLPPWRQSQSLLSKWLLSQSRERPMAPPHSPPSIAVLRPFLVLHPAANASAVAAKFDNGSQQPGSLAQACLIQQQPAASPCTVVCPAASGSDGSGGTSLSSGSSGASPPPPHPAATPPEAVQGPHRQRQAASATPGGSGGLPRRKSLLSLDLAASGLQQQGSRPAAGDGSQQHRHQHREPQRQQQPSCGAADGMHIGKLSQLLAMAFDAAEPAPVIRTVKMQR